VTKRTVASRQATDKVIILDRDGTIVVDRHYLSDPEELEFEQEAAIGLRKMRDLGFRLVIITNQSGIARGFFSLSRLDEIHAKLKQMLSSIGIALAGIYFCPHAPDDACDCRKPQLRLMRQASEDLGFDMSQAIVIGDKESDVEFGRLAGAVTMLIAKPAGTVSTTAADYIVANLNEAADILSENA
jgi:D-glycero-D-manno-heptose 1,7-bisphosphate phosphatase